MKIILITICLLATSLSVGAQLSRVISLEECQQQARDNYPLIKRYDLIKLSERYNIENVNRKYLPQIEVNGIASYQSSVVKLPFDLPDIDFPKKSKDQYKVMIDISQTIWDGGDIKAQRNIVNTKSELDRQNVEVDLYQIRERINQLYFGILSIDKQLEIVRLHEDNLNTSLDYVEALYKNGVAMASDIDVIRVEQLNIEQQKIELQAVRQSYLKVLSAFINVEIDEQTIFQMPYQEINLSQDIKRPEINLFQKQRSLFDTQAGVISAKNLPKISFFVQGGYGRPALNILSNDFDFFSIGGIKLSWNFGNLYTRKNEIRLIQTSKSMVDVEEEVFRFNTRNHATQVYREIEKYKDLMLKDDDIILLRQQIKEAGENKYKNGVYTINDLVKDINGKRQAHQTKAWHEIEYLSSIYKYKNIQGE